jgi:flagellar motor switch protein FliM
MEAVEQEVHRSGVHVLLDKVSQSKVRLPMLEVVYDRFVRENSNSLRNFTSYTVDVEIADNFTYKFDDIMQKYTKSSVLSVFKAIEWDHFGLIIGNADLVYSCVDILFGGRKVQQKMHFEERAFTSIELGIIRNIFDVVLEDLSKAFEPIAPISFQIERTETNYKFAMIVRPEDVCNVLRLNVIVGNRSGELTIILPYPTIEPVKKILGKSFIDERGGKDPIWNRFLEGEIKKTTAEIEAVFGGRTATVNDFTKFKVGSTIVLDIPPTSPVNIKLNGITIAQGQLGKIDDYVAVKLNNVLINENNK